MKSGPWAQIFIGAAASVLASVLIGGIAFANAMDNRTQKLEVTSEAQGQTIRDQRIKIKDLSDTIHKMDRMITFLATKAGYTPSDMGER